MATLDCAQAPGAAMVARAAATAATEIRVIRFILTSSFI
jgi:hypothetical protein